MRGTEPPNSWIGLVIQGILILVVNSTKSYGVDRRRIGSQYAVASQYQSWKGRKPKPRRQRGSQLLRFLLLLSNSLFRRSPLFGNLLWIALSFSTDFSTYLSTKGSERCEGARLENCSLMRQTPPAGPLIEGIGMRSWSWSLRSKRSISTIIFRIGRRSEGGRVITLSGR